MQYPIQTMENVFQAVSENLHLIKTKKYRNAIKEFNESYQTVILISVHHFGCEDIKDEKLFSAFTKKTISNSSINILEYQEKLIQKLNRKEEIRAYSFLPSGLGHYESLDELVNQLIRQSCLEEKKYIYADIKLDDVSELEQALIALTKELKNTLLLVVGIDDNDDVPFLLWKEKEIKKNWIIRHLNEKEYSPFIHMSRDFENLYTRSRRDIFNSKVPYSKMEFAALCIPYQLRFLLIYEEDGNMLGFIEGQILNTEDLTKYADSRVMKINKLFVKKENRRKKIATRLYQELVQRAKTEKCDRIEVQVYHFTPEAQSFFASLGLKVLSYQYEINVEKK